MNLLAILDQVLPLWVHSADIALIRSRIRVQEKKADLKMPMDPTWEVYLELEESTLREALKTENGRREAMQRRALALIGFVAVMSAFTLGLLAFLRTHPPGLLKASLGVAGFLTVIYVASGAWWSLQVVRPTLVSDAFLQSYMKEGQVLCGRSLKEMYLSVIQLTQAYNLVYAWYSEKSFRCVRNGLWIIAATLFAVLLVFSQP